MSVVVAALQLMMSPLTEMLKMRETCYSKHVLWEFVVAAVAERVKTMRTMVLLLWRLNHLS